MPASTNQFGVTVPPAHSIGDFINGQLTGSTEKYQFPEDLPKYYTTITFKQFKGGTGAGGYRDSFGRGYQALKDWIASASDDNPAKALAQEALKDIEAGLGGQSGTPAFDGGATIILPLPIQLTDVHHVHWDEKPIVPWVSAIAPLLGAGTDVIRAASGLFGLAPNYFQTILFDRPEFKKHKLEFKLSPRNFTESTKIRDIIWAINNAMSPGTDYKGFMFTFPNMVQVTLRPNDGWLFKFKPCIIETMGLNYAGGEQKKAFYHGDENPPESVEITLDLVELEYWINDGNGGQFTKGNTR